MAAVVNKKRVIDEIVLDANEEEDDDELNDCKMALTKFNESQIEQRRGDANGFHCDEDDSMDYEEITRINQPVDFIFAIEDDDGVETDIGTHATFSKESHMKSTSNDSVKSVPAKSDPPMRSTRFGLRQQPNLQNGQSALLSTTPSVTKSIERKKARPSGSLDPAPPIQLRSSVREPRNLPTKPVPQSTPNEIKINGKRSTTIPSNSVPATQSNQNEPKSAKKATNNPTVNAPASTPTVGPKSTKKTVNIIKESAKTPETNKATTSNGKPAGVVINGITKSNQKTKNLPETPTTITTVTDKQGSTKKRTRSYWTGREHIRKIGPETPFVMIERLPLFLSGDTEYKGHDCNKTVCPAARKLTKCKSPAPPPRIEPLDTISATINNVVKDVPLSPEMPPGRPKIGQNIRFQFWQTPLGNNVPVKSSHQKAKIIDYNPEYDVYEIQLFHYDHPFIIAALDKTTSKRVTTNTMIIDWNSLADPSII